jgi:dihydroorotase
MQLKTTQKLELPATADMHVHLRQGEMMELVVPTLRDGGVDTAFV